MNDLTTTQAAGLPATAADYDAYAGLSTGIKQQDMAMPFLQIIQSLSPQRDRTEAKYIPGAEEGMFFDNVTNELFDGSKGMLVIPVFTKTTYIEWKTREAGGGFVAEHYENGEALLKTTQKDDKGRDRLPNGNQLAKTMSYVVARTNEDGSKFEPAVINFTSTQLKKARNWNTLISKLALTDADGKVLRDLGNIIFAGTYRFTTVKEKNDKGSWYGFHIESAGITKPGSQAFLKAAELHKALAGGTATVDMSRAADDEVPV